MGARSPRRARVQRPQLRGDDGDPADLEDFALGFALTEGLAKQPSDLTDIAVAEVEQGWIVRARSPASASSS
jgi:hypothetical protein